VTSTVNHPDKLVHLEEEPPNWQCATGLDLGMNLISADFDILMVNQASESFQGRSITELLGKKCYREFAKREDVCPNCPGVVALRTGRPCRAELEGMRDDGTRYTVSCLVHPVVGRDAEAIGFIELGQDITERKRVERTNEALDELQHGLLCVSEPDWTLRKGLSAALSLEGIQWGLAFRVQEATTMHHLVARRGLSRDLADALARTRLDPGCIKLSPSPAGATEAPGPGPLRAVNTAYVVPVRLSGQIVGKLVVGLLVQGRTPDTTTIALKGIALSVGDALARIRLEESRRNAGAELSALIAALPLAVWVTDSRGMVTEWNRMAELKRPGFHVGSFNRLPRLEWRVADCSARAFQGAPAA